MKKRKVWADKEEKSAAEAEEKSAKWVGRGNVVATTAHSDKSLTTHINIFF